MLIAEKNDLADDIGRENVSTAGMTNAAVAIINVLDKCITFVNAD